MTGQNQQQFGVRGALSIEGPPGRQLINYWFRSPFFWRIEQDGILVLQTGTQERVRIPGQTAVDLRLLSKPKILAHDFGLYGIAPGLSEIHSPTGRAVHRIQVAGDSPASMSIDDATSFALQFRGNYKGQIIAGDHDQFEVAEMTDPAIFGETSFSAQGYYHGSLG
jgi:hypothetical protein